MEWFERDGRTLLWFAGYAMAAAVFIADIQVGSGSLDVVARAVALMSAGVVAEILGSNPLGFEGGVGTRSSRSGIGWTLAMLCGVLGLATAADGHGPMTRVGLATLGAGVVLITLPRYVLAMLRRILSATG